MKKILVILFGAIISIIVVTNFLPLRDPFAELGAVDKPYSPSAWTKDVLEGAIGDNLYSGFVGGIVSSALNNTQEDYGFAKEKTWGAAKLTYHYPGKKDTTITVKNLKIERSIKTTNVLAWDTFYDISFQLPNLRYVLMPKLLRFGKRAGNTSSTLSRDEGWMFANVRVIEPEDGFQDIMLKDKLYPDFVMEIYPENRVQYWKKDDGKFILSFKRP
jgi:hypothetical protein